MALISLNKKRIERGKYYIIYKFTWKKLLNKNQNKPFLSRKN